MASGGVEEKTQIDTDICNCTICLDTFKVPKILPCLHTFCESCLNSYILSSKDEKCPSPHFLCPVCRTEVKMSDTEVPSEKWAQLMPLNNMVASLIEDSSTDQEESERKCNPCERHGESEQGHFWCFECRENLCDFCRKCHQRVKAVSGHKIVPVNELKKEDFGVKFTNVEEPCFEHKDEFLKVYCIDHQKMCCVLCLSIVHRKCENIKTFDQMIEILEESGETQKLTDNINKFGQKMEELIVKKQGNVDDLEQQKQDILENVAKMIEQAKEKLDTFHEDFKVHLSQTHKEQSTKLMDMKERFEMFQKSIENCKRMLQAVLKHGPPKQIFITSEKIKIRLDLQLRELQELLDTDEVIAYDSNVDKHVTDINNSMKTAAVLELKKTVSKESFEPDDRFFRNGYKDALLQSQLKTANICDLEAVKLWDIKQDGGYRDAVFLHNDDELLVVDYKNKVLLVYDNDGKVSFSHSVDYTPWGITQRSGGEILVSDIKSPGIRIYTLEHQKLQQISFLATTQLPRAIDIVQDSILAVQKKSVMLLTQDRTRLNTIGPCGEYSFVSASKTDTGCLYCCDDGNCVAKYTFDGNEITRHQLENIKDPRGVAVDNAGNIYVCGRNSHNVFILSKDSMSSRILLSEKDGIFYPYSIGFDHTGIKFFLTSCDNGTVAVFRLRLKPRN